MDNRNSIGTWIVYGIIAIIAFYVIKFLLAIVLGFLGSLIHTAISIAIVVGIIYLLVMIFGRKRASY